MRLNVEKKKEESRGREESEKLAAFEQQSVSSQTSCIPKPLNLKAKQRKLATCCLSSEEAHIDLQHRNCVVDS